MSNKMYVKAVVSIKKILHNSPTDVTLILSVFASHGMIQSGRQTILINEFEKATGFYRLIGAEENIRAAAINCTNSYFITIFACCREILLR